MERRRRDGNETRLEIATHDGTFELVWDAAGKLVRIDNLRDPKGWHWDNVNPWAKVA